MYMQIEKVRKIGSWVLVVICMGVIFYFSSRTSEDSAEQSGAVLGILTRIFGDNFITDFIVRKMAHFLEFTGLGLLCGNSFHLHYKKYFWPAIFLASFYAVTDEVHQIFVEGRACRFSDWAIDTSGAIIGIIAFWIIALIVRKIKSNKLTPSN